MGQRQFGSSQSTGRKLDLISEYLKMYQMALSRTRLSTVYIDGFAGSGEIPQGEVSASLFDHEVSTIITGSARRAFEVDP
jgi:three-Cys-motif partner protein